MKSPQSVCIICSSINWTAYVRDELNFHEQRDAQKHLSHCLSCQEEVVSLQKVIIRLQTAPETQAKPDAQLTANVLRAIQSSSAKASPDFYRNVWHWSAAAAILIMSALVSLHSSRKAHSPTLMAEKDTPSVKIADSTPSQIATQSALAWLTLHQEADGSWNLDRWGGQKQYTPAIVALPIIALTQAPDLRPEHEATARRAIKKLLTLQRADGSFRSSNGAHSPHNDSLATLALLHAFQRFDNTVPPIRLHDAIERLISPAADLLQDKWQHQALSLAASQGWPQAQKILSSLSPQSHNPTQLIECSDKLFSTYSSHQVTSTVLTQLIQQQQHDSDGSGSWLSPDPWSQAGGRVYCTAVALLILVNHQKST